MRDQDGNPYPWRDALLLRIIPPLGAFTIKTLMKTCRIIHVEGDQREQETRERHGGRALYVSWHQRMAYFSYHLGPMGLTIMISRSKDGEYATRIASGLGFESVRGSSTSGGSRALIELIRRIRNGGRGGILADGPQGPARVAKMGTLMIAQKAEVPIIPVAFGVDRCWIFNSWDRDMVPKPFSKIILCFGEPFGVPPSARGEELESYRLFLEERLNKTTHWCDNHFGIERPWRQEK